MPKNIVQFHDVMLKIDKAERLETIVRTHPLWEKYALDDPNCQSHYYYYPHHKLLDPHDDLQIMLDRDVSEVRDEIAYEYAGMRYCLVDSFDESYDLFDDFAQEIDFYLDQVIDSYNEFNKWLDVYTEDDPIGLSDSPTIDSPYKLTSSDIEDVEFLSE